MGLAMGLSAAAGACTLLGGALVFFVRASNHRFLSLSLGLATGVMVRARPRPCSCSAARLPRDSRQSAGGPLAVRRALLQRHPHTIPHNPRQTP